MNGQIRCASCSRTLRVARLECEACEVAVEGTLDLPPLARLPSDDQLFVIAFLRHHGSIKQMERVFEISYPTVKKRLNAITARLDRELDGGGGNAAILDRLAAGDITFEQALDQIR